MLLEGAFFYSLFFFCQTILLCKDLLQHTPIRGETSAKRNYSANRRSCMETD